MTRWLPEPDQKRSVLPGSDGLKKLFVRPGHGHLTGGHHAHGIRSIARCKQSVFRANKKYLYDSRMNKSRNPNYTCPAAKRTDTLLIGQPLFAEMCIGLCRLSSAFVSDAPPGQTSQGQTYSTPSVPIPGAMPRRGKVKGQSLPVTTGPSHACANMTVP